MADYNPIFRSPIAVQVHTSGTQNPQSKIQNLKLSDLAGIQVTLIQGDAGDVLPKQFPQLPAKPGELVDVGPGLLARLTPTEFYLFGKFPAAELPSPTTLDDSFVKAKRFAHATDLTHGIAALRLVGVLAPELLSKICGLDFHDTVFPNMRVAQTSAAKIKTMVARYDEGDTRAYFLHVARPLGSYFWEVVWDAGQEFGLADVPAE